VSVARLSFHGRDGGAIGEHFASKARPPPVTLHEVEKKVGLCPSIVDGWLELM
jgi:hypothetical protein